ncbi:MAG TPA: secretin N-terminal domain-containing protein [Burkholderiales bacterium]|nr:secretin N-terminal domain-containing protein [Burkholderiales bacterium]
MKKLLVVVLFLFGCATSPQFTEGQKLVESGNVEEGLAQIEQELKKDPTNAEIRNYYERQKAVAVQRWLATGDVARSQGNLDQADAAYKMALRFDPANARAKAGISAVEIDRKTSGKVAEAEAAFRKGDTETAYAKAKEVLAENPQQKDAKAIVRKVEEKKYREESVSPKLSAALKKPITMEFRDAPLRQVFELVSKHTGLNFVFDKEVPGDARATVFVRNTTIDDVIRFVLVTNQLERRVLNENTVLIYPNTPNKQQAYRDLIVKSFYLSNADVKQTANLIRQVVKTRDMFVDEKLNLLVMRDTPEAIRVAEKLIANQDLAEAEVMLEVEVLEVGYNKLQQLGVQLPGSLGIGITGAAGVAGQITGTEAKNLNSGLFRITVPDPLVTLNARRQDGRTNVLANPRIRVKSKEKAKIHIGDKVPVITTTAGATGFVSESINYLDVGLKLEVEPQVHLEDEVGIKIGLEVSNIASQIRTGSGTIAYQVGTRNASTTLRLKDGETQVLAGLINDEDRRNAVGTPGIADLPVLGRIFSNRDETANKTEVVLLITPRVIRNIERPGIRLEEFNSGTEVEVGGAPLQLNQAQSQPAPVPPSVTPTPVPAPAPAPAEQPARVPPMVSPTAPESIPPRAPAAGPEQKK